MFCLLTRIASITLFFKIFEIIGGSCTRVGLPVLPRFLHYNLEVMGSSCGNNLFACNGKVSYVGSLVHLAAVTGFYTEGEYIESASIKEN